MRLVNWPVAEEFINKNGNARDIVEAFRVVIGNINDANTPPKLQQHFGKRMDTIKGNRYCINIGGNNIRTIVVVEFAINTMEIKWIGWHPDYDKLCKKNLQYNVGN